MQDRLRHGLVFAFFCIVLCYIGRSFVMGRSLIQGVLSECLKGFIVSAFHSESEQVRGSNLWNMFHVIMIQITRHKCKLLTYVYIKHNLNGWTVHFQMYLFYSFILFVSSFIYSFCNFPLFSHLFLSFWQKFVKIFRPYSVGGRSYSFQFVPWMFLPLWQCVTKL